MQFSTASDRGKIAVKFGADNKPSSGSEHDIGVQAGHGCARRRAYLSGPLTDTDRRLIPGDDFALSAMHGGRGEAPANATAKKT